MQTLAVFGRRGSGAGAFERPHGIAATVDGRVYVADTGNRRIARLRWDPVARALEWVGSWPAGEPFDVDADQRGRVWVTDRATGAVLGYADEAAGAGSGLLPPPIVPGDRWPLHGDVEAPLGLAVADSLDPWLQPDANRLYLVDRDGRRLRAFDADGRVVAAVAPADVAPGRAEARFFYVELDFFGNVWVSDPGGALYKLDPRLRPLDVFTGPGPPDETIEEPRGIAIWKRFGQVFVAEREGARYFFVGADVRAPAEPLPIRRRDDPGGWSFDLFLTEPSTVRVAFLDAAGDTLAVADAGTVWQGRQTIDGRSTAWEIPPGPGWSERSESIVVEARPTYSSRRRFARVRAFEIAPERP